MKPVQLADGKLEFNDFCGGCYRAYVRDVDFLDFKTYQFENISNDLTDIFEAYAESKDSDNY